MKNSLDYQKYRKMILLKANQHSRKTGISADELESEGNLIFVKAAQSFDESKHLKFSTFLWTCLENGLINFANTFRRGMHEDLEEVVVETGYAGHKLIESQLYVQEILNALPSTAKEAILLLLNNPMALGLDGTEPPKIMRGAITRYLQKQLGNQAAWQTMREIKAIIREA